MPALPIGSRRRRALAAVVVVLTALALAAAAAVPADAATATGRWSSGYTGRQVHATWAGPGVGLIAWTVAVDVSAYKACRSSWTTVNVDTAWDSSSLHNGAKLAIVESVETSDGRSHYVGSYVVSRAVPWPGHPAFDGQRRVQVYTPGGVHVVVSHVQSWIDNGGFPFLDPTGSGDSKTLAQFKRC